MKNCEISRYQIAIKINCSRFNLSSTKVLVNIVQTAGLAKKKMTRRNRGSREQRQRRKKEVSNRKKRR